MAPVELTQRKATPADALAIANLVRSAYRGESSRAGWTTEADLLTNDRIDEADVADRFDDPAATVLVYHDPAGALVACCELLRRDAVPTSSAAAEGAVAEASPGQPASALLGMFAVDPQRQAGGFGSRVLAGAEAYAKGALGVRSMRMHVIWVREELIAFYNRRGYAATGETAPFPHHVLEEGQALRDDLHFVVLEKALL